MQFPVVPLDLINLLFLPLMVVTVVEVKKNWSALWDQELTAHDRYLLQRIVIFWLIPAVVFFHELGHVGAIKLFGGQIKEFHYAFVWGYVVPTGTFTPAELVWSYLSGNLVQIIIGLGALVGALRARAPAAVAILVYLFLWSVGGTTIVYTLLSFTGLYGDWVAIYTQPEHYLVSIIAVCHGVLAFLVLWCLYGSAPRLWFVCHTNPRWLSEQDSLWSKVKSTPSATSWLDLGWSFYRVGLNSRVTDCLRKARMYDLNVPEALLLEGALAYRHGKRREALRIYTAASEAKPEQADAHFYKAIILSDLECYAEAKAELIEATNLHWSNSVLKELLCKELQNIQSKIAGQK